MSIRASFFCTVKLPIPSYIVIKLFNYKLLLHTQKKKKKETKP